MTTSTRRTARLASAVLTGAGALGVAGVVTAAPASAGPFPTAVSASSASRASAVTAASGARALDLSDIVHTVGPVIPPGVICCGNLGFVAELEQLVAGPGAG